MKSIVIDGKQCVTNEVRASAAANVLADRHIPLYVNVQLGTQWHVIQVAKESLIGMLNVIVIEDNDPMILWTAFDACDIPSVLISRSQ